MYSRVYAGKTVRFEPSGGLVHSALILQDKERDSYWSIMEGKAVAGDLSGTKLIELPLGEKMQWRRWREKHPDTLVLSVNGREDASNRYAEYFQDPRGVFADAKDDRLPSKAPIFAFHHLGSAYAIPVGRIEDGTTFALEGGVHAFLHRKRGSSMFRSTDALSTAGFAERGDVWVETLTGAAFDPESGSFADDSVRPLLGFDTFWYVWSLNNPDTHLLR